MKNKCASRWVAVVVLSLAMSAIQTVQAFPHPSHTKRDAPSCSVKPIRVGQAWKIEYSFGGGIPMPGRGTVHLTLANDGHAALSVIVHKKPTQTRTVKIPVAAMEKINNTLRKSPPSCMHTRLRQGYVVVDMGAYVLKFTSAGKTVAARVDECHYVDRGGKTFEAIVDSIQGLKPYLGNEIAWNSMAATNVKSDACVSSGRNAP
jgi:hypothetical protein